jgi:hypothetical protein
MVIRRVIDAAFAVRLGWVWDAEVLASCRKATGPGMLETGTIDHLFAPECSGCVEQGTSGARNLGGEGGDMRGTLGKRSHLAWVGRRCVRFDYRLGDHRLDVLISAVPKGDIVFTVTASRAA